MTHVTVTVNATSWDEERLAEPNADHSVARVTFRTEWTGAVEGTSTCWLLIAYVSGDPAHPQTLTGPYHGFELVTATIEGRVGTFVLSAAGGHNAGAARTDVDIVAGSGTGELAGISGSGRYAAEAMQYTMELDYELG